MQEQMAEDLSLEAMAQQAAMSPHHFLRIFRQLTGIPPVRFLNAIRLEEAKKLLLTTERSVTDICADVGYKSLGTFTTRFTQLVGLSPGQFRTLGRAFTVSSNELIALAVDHLSAHSKPDGNAIRGRVIGNEDIDGPIFVGLFTHPIPQERPVACAVLKAPGRFDMNVSERGTFFLFAAGIGQKDRAADSLLCGSSIRGIASLGPLKLTEDGHFEEPVLVLRPPAVLDPPLLITLPILIDERLADLGGSDGKEI